MDDLLSAWILGVAALVQGFLGFGFGIIAMGALGLLHDPWHAAGVVNLTGLLQTACMALLLRHSIQWRLVWRILPASAVGIVIGLRLLGQLQEAMLMQLLGLCIVALSLWNLSPWRPQTAPSPHWDAPVGLLSGLLTGMFNTGGPPLVMHLYRRPEPPTQLIATVQALFVANALIRLPGAAAMGMLTPAVRHDAAIAAGFVIAGVLLGRALGRVVSPERFQRTSWRTLCVLGLWIAWSS